MKPRLRRVLRLLAWGLGAPLLLGIAVAWFLLGTQAGARFLFARLGAFVPGSFEVAEVGGPIRGPLSVRGLKYHSDTLDVTIDRAVLDWRLAKLLERQLDILSFRASGVTIVQGLPKEVQKKKQGPLPDMHFSVNIILRDALVEKIALTRPGATAPIMIDRIELGTTARGEVVDVQKLLVRAPAFTLDASGSLRPQGAYPVDLKLAWTAHPAGYGAFEGRGVIGGTFDRMEVTHDLTLPFRSHVVATLTKPMSALAFEGTVDVAGFDPRMFKPDAMAARIDAHASGTGTIDTLTAQGRVATRLDPYGQVEATFAVIRDHDTWRFDPAVVTLPGTPARIEVRGSVVTAPALRFDVAGSWKQLAWPLRGTPLVASASGTANASGTPADYRFRVQAALGGPQIPAGAWTADGRGDAAHVELASVSGNVLGGQLHADGNVTWSPEVAWKVRVDGRGLDPSTVMPGWQGAISVAAASEGHLTPAGPQGRVAPLTAGGTLKGEALSAQGAIDLRGREYGLDDFRVSWGAARARVAGRVGDALDVAYHLELPDLGHVMPELAGNIGLDGHVSGRPTAPRIVAQGGGGGLKYGTAVAASRLALRADVDLAPEGRIAADIHFDGVETAGQRFDTLSLRADGTRAAHRLLIDLASRPESMHAELAGGLSPANAWDGQLRALVLRSKEAGEWRLMRPATLRAAATGAELAGLCLVSGRARACADGGWRSGAGWKATAAIDDLPLGLAQPYLPAGIRVAGTLAGRAHATSDAAGVLTAEVNLSPSNGAVTYPGPDGKPSTFRYEQPRVTITVGAPGTEARAHVVLAGIGPIDAQAKLPGFRALGMPPPAQPVEAHLQSRLSDLTFIEAFVPQATRIAGRLEANLAVGGTVGTPLVRGDAGWRDGSLDVPAYGLELREASIGARGDSSRLLVVEGHVRSGPGTIDVRGSAPLAPSKQSPARITIRGRRFQAMNTEQIAVLVSPAIDIAFDGARVDATGQVNVPSAKVEIKELPKGAVPVSKDVVFIDEGTAGQPRRTPIAVYARVRLVLKTEEIADKIELKAMGFDGQPEGSLLLIEEPGKPPTGSGEIRIAAGGTFKAYGQNLAIDEGRFMFAGGSVTNPGLFVRAHRAEMQDPNVKAGIEVTGTAQKPQLTLWSEPPMSESDQLAYVLLGHPLGQSQPQEGSMVANAAQSLGLKGGALLAKKIGAQFGLSEAKVETQTKDGLNQASLMLGKYLSPRLYVAYGIGVFNAANTFRVRYLIDTHWTLQAETGSGTSADVFYTIERGRPDHPLPPTTTEEALTPQRVPASGTGGTGTPGGSRGP